MTAPPAHSCAAEHGKRCRTCTQLRTPDYFKRKSHETCHLPNCFCLISACKKAKEADRALKIYFEGMPREGVRPDVTTVGLLISACEREARLEASPNCKVFALDLPEELLDLKATVDAQLATAFSPSEVPEDIKTAADRFLYGVLGEEKDLDLSWCPAATLQLLERCGAADTLFEARINLHAFTSLRLPPGLTELPGWVRRLVNLASLDAGSIAPDAIVLTGLNSLKLLMLQGRPKKVRFILPSGCVLNWKSSKPK